MPGVTREQLEQALGNSDDETFFISNVVFLGSFTRSDGTTFHNLARLFIRRNPFGLENGEDEGEKLINVDTYTVYGPDDQIADEEYDSLWEEVNTVDELLELLAQHGVKLDTLAVFDPKKHILSDEDIAYFCGGPEL